MIWIFYQLYDGPVQALWPYSDDLAAPVPPKYAVAAKTYTEAVRRAIALQKIKSARQAGVEVREIGDG